ncbi:MAG: tetratricopeptide repeat protein [Chloroflexales bacterium]|nr:tetratricopeptide repeat protein [Chloroflexales bacterium]
MLTSVLRQSLTTFVGRECELSELTRLLTAARLLTLTGTGGIGKTRLALQLASASSAQFPDGVVWVSLVSLSDWELVLPTIAHSLGIGDGGPQTIWASVCAYLQPRRMLIVLDNFEHLREAAPQMADLLAATTQLILLTTSRESLQIAGEQVYPVPPLALPDRTAQSAPDVLVQSEAVQLFLSRAQAVRPDFVVTPTSGPVVAEICRRLDGLPLAIELAAAWVRSLPPQALLARIDTQLLHLMSRTLGAPERHQTLHAAISWSYNLLDAAEQQLFDRLAIFVGGWTLEAAEAVCIVDPAEAATFLERQAALLDKSLVMQPHIEGEPRFQMLATIREYAAERLAKRGEFDTLQQCHARFFLKLAERAEPELRGAQQQAWFARLATDYDNIRAALQYLIKRGDTESALRIAGALGRFWWIQGHLDEGRQWLDRVLAMPLSAPDEAILALRAKVLTVAGALAMRQDDTAVALHLFEAGLAINQQMEDHPGMARLFASLGLLAMAREDYTAARTRFEASLAIWRDLNNTWGVASNLGNLGYVALLQGDDATAQSLLDESLALLRQIGDTWSIANALTNLGDVARQQNDYVQARRYLHESLHLKSMLDSHQGMAWSLEVIAQLAMDLGQTRRGVQILGAATDLRTAIGSLRIPAEQARAAHIIAEARASLGEQAFAEAWAAGQSLTLNEAITLAQEELSAPPAPAAPAPSSSPGALADLTPRELEVLRLVSTGMTNKEIARELTLSHYTVQDYVRSILDKLDVSSRSAATRYAVAHGLVAVQPAEASGDQPAGG